MQCQAPSCTETIHDERLIAQPNTKTCGKPECKREYRRMVAAHHMKEYRRRKKEGA